MAFTDVINYTLNKISDELGFQTSKVTIKFLEEVIEWEARATYLPTLPAPGVGELVGGSGEGDQFLTLNLKPIETSNGGIFTVYHGSFVVDYELDFDIDYTELTFGDRIYSIDIHAKKSDNTWG